MKKLYFLTLFTTFAVFGSTASYAENITPTGVGDIPTDFYPMGPTPCRIMDTRHGIAGHQRFAPGETRDIYIFDIDNTVHHIVDQGGDADCIVPPFAIAVAITVSAVGPARSGFIKVWPFNDPKPATAGTILNWTDSNGISTGATIQYSNNFADQPNLKMKAALSDTDVVIDVFGYYIEDSQP